MSQFIPQDRAMPQNQLLTLLSDFGLSDVYVGVMKGEIALINPHLTVIDLTHEIPPQSIAAARFCLMSAYTSFPKGSVHVAVVDPGVGSKRRSLAIEFTQGFLVGPDNGIFSGVLSQCPAITAVELTNPKYWKSPQPSRTFHGRDIFAPVGAHLASGVPIAQLGKQVDIKALVQLTMPDVTSTNTTITGCVQYIDRFGNLVTNIPGTTVQNKTWNVLVKGLTIPGCNTYSDVAPGNAITLIGSHGYIEIAVANGNAQKLLQLTWGVIVQVEV